MGIISAVLILAGFVIIGSMAWKKWGNNTSTVGKTITGFIDTADALGAYTNLTLIRQLDSIEADPQAIIACDYLRNVVTAWKRPDSLATKPAVTVSVNGVVTEIIA